MPSAASRFWADTERYHDLAETYERNIVISHPYYVTYYGIVNVPNLS